MSQKRLAPGQRVVFTPVGDRSAQTPTYVVVLPWGSRSVLCGRVDDSSRMGVFLSNMCHVVKAA